MRHFERIKKEKLELHPDFFYWALQRIYMKVRDASDWEWLDKWIYVLNIKHTPEDMLAGIETDGRYIRIIDEAIKGKIKGVDLASLTVGRLEGSTFIACIDDQDRVVNALRYCQSSASSGFYYYYDMDDISENLPWRRFDNIRRLSTHNKGK